MLETLVQEPLKGTIVRYLRTTSWQKWLLPNFWNPTRFPQTFCVTSGRFPVSRLLDIFLRPTDDDVLDLHGSQLLDKQMITMIMMIMMIIMMIIMMMSLAMQFQGFNSIVYTLHIKEENWPDRRRRPREWSSWRWRSWWDGGWRGWGQGRSSCRRRTGLRARWTPRSEREEKKWSLC